MLLLERKNAHPRDTRITFNEAEHFYTVDSRRVVGSCSSLWASYFSRFDAKETAARLVTRHAEATPPDDDQDPLWKWRYAHAYDTLVCKHTSEDTCQSMEKVGCRSFDFADHDKGYRRLFWYIRKKGIDRRDDQIDALTKLWNALGERASSRGTFVHRQAELHCNDEPYEDGVEMDQYLRFRAANPHLRPYRTEWSVFSYAHGGAHIVAGQIDGLYFNELNQTYEMIDYKVTAHELTPDNPYQKYGKAPFDAVPDTPWGHYCVQQNIYAYILRQNYGVTVKRCRLLRLHDTIKDYQLVDVADLTPQVRSLFDECASTHKMNVAATPKRLWTKAMVCVIAFVRLRRP